MPKSLRIHFFVQTAHKQGTFFRYHNLAIGLVKLGHTVVVYAASYEANGISYTQILDEVEYNITCCNFPLKRFFGTWSHPMAAVKRLFKIYPSCDVAHLFQPHISAFLPWFVNRYKSNLNIYDWDDLWTDGLVVKQAGVYNRFVYKQVKFIEEFAPKIADQVTTCSTFLINKLMKLNVKSSKLVHNGFWPYKFNNKLESRKKLNLNPEVFYIGFMGRTINEISWCFQLLERAISIYPEVRLALCGMPIETITNYHGELKRNIDYLGFLTPEQARDFSNSLDVGLLPLENNDFNKSRFPIKFAEYLASSTPILCTNVGECGQISRHLPFVAVSQSSVQEFINLGISMIGRIKNNNWPVVDNNSINSLLNWELISKEIELYYISCK